MADERRSNSDTESDSTKEPNAKSEPEPEPKLEDEPTLDLEGDKDEGPLGALATAVRSRGTRSSEFEFEFESESETETESSPHSHTGERATTADAETLFEHEPVDEIDRDALWEQIQRGATTEFDTGEAQLTDREIRTVQKRDYCHGCEHFEAPPHVGCTHDGTDILEFPTLETVRIADCPVVLEDEALEDRR